jgi:hypothetical protein
MQLEAFESECSRSSRTSDDGFLVRSDLHPPTGYCERATTPTDQSLMFIVS